MLVWNFSVCGRTSGNYFSSVPNVVLTAKHPIDGGIKAQHSACVNSEIWKYMIWFWFLYAGWERWRSIVAQISDLGCRRRCPRSFTVGWRIFCLNLRAFVSSTWGGIGYTGREYSWRSIVAQISDLGCRRRCQRSFSLGWRILCLNLLAFLPSIGAISDTQVGSTVGDLASFAGSESFERKTSVYGEGKRNSVWIPTGDVRFAGPACCG